MTSSNSEPTGSERTGHVVVCGSGLAGLTTAIAAAEHGATVTLLEKGDELGGSFVISGGLIWTWGDRETIEAEVPLADHRLTRLLVDHLAEDLEWLGGWGVKFLEQMPAHLIGLSVDPRPTVETLARLVEEAGGRVVTGVGLAGLDTTSGVTVQVADRNDGRRHEIPCGAVVLATGGFQGSAELVARYLGVSPATLLLRANPWSTGDALDTVLGSGGALSPGMDDFYGHSFPDTGSVEIPDRDFRAVCQYWGNVGVALNLRGERFCDEGEGTTFENRLNFALAHQPQGTGFYLIDDATARKTVMPDGTTALTAIQRARDIGTTVIEAESLDELCRLLDRDQGVPYERSLASVTEFQRHMRSESSSALYPPRHTNRVTLQEPPFRAVKVRAAITFTGGGIAVDEEMRVLARAGSVSGLPSPGNPAPRENHRNVVLPGVFAAGVDVGNVSHGGYVGGLAAAVVFGRIAGRNAAHYALNGT